MNNFWADVFVRTVVNLITCLLLAWLYAVYLCLRNCYRAGNAEGKLRWAVTGAAVFLGFPMLIANIAA